MRLESGHPGKVFAVQREMRHLPLDGFAKAGHRIMHQRAQMDQDRPGKGAACSI
jgi:hypothetical protein